MSIRISLYDFFAYTFPGMFYLIILGFWGNILGLINIDLKTISSLSTVQTAMIIGLAYILGLLIDLPAYKWFKLFGKRNRDVAKDAYNDFCLKYSWLSFDFNSTDWGILFNAVKSKSLDIAVDIEQHNVAFIMLRNISLGLILSSVSCLLYFLFFQNNYWNIVFCIVFFVLFLIAMRRCKLRRYWFYNGIFEAFAAQYLLDEKLKHRKNSKEEVDQTDIYKHSTDVE